jgi:predicted P-loop ATPase
MKYDNYMNIDEFLKRFRRWLFRERKEEDSPMFSSINERQRIVEGVRRFFNENYELRYNVMKQTEEFCRKEPSIVRQEPLISQQEPLILREEPLIQPKEPVWQQLTDREFRKMAIEQMEKVGVAWSIDVELYVRSALIPNYSPVLDYLGRCGTWDGQTDHIRDLARRVPTSFDRWPDYFHGWMLAMVAQWLNLSYEFGNAIVPMLIGAQGTHKSTFCRLLLPPQLREYYIDDIKLDNAEQVERMLSRMLLVNIDEYNAKTDREQAKIKRVLTEKNVQTRKMRSDQYVLLPRMASFIATTNDMEPLYDPTGSRRYLCCEVTGIIDTDTAINHRAIYAQAVTELRGGAQWYFSKDDEADIERHNQNYRRQTTPETVLLSYFEPAERSKEHFMLAVEIQKDLRKHVRTTDVPSIKKLTLALKACHFPYGKIQGVRGWYARKRDLLS